ncbi:hypothetical protein IWQ60_004090 [Tieghemiomyces parasiticus]|uniref:Pentacotripeptide-repeat region of PRORP domain-containing protein n=1 Tax=Tieghemiomyces parasiticus TaxID=78921 RepID=A0A9W8DVV1_9FUNG|nr:hypothetical protein IWQ60_004090 [Tieghemiomyces parasiticus]
MIPRIANGSVLGRPAPCWSAIGRPVSLLSQNGTSRRTAVSASRLVPSVPFARTPVDLRYSPSNPRTLRTYSTDPSPAVLQLIQACRAKASTDELWAAYDRIRVRNEIEMVSPDYLSLLLRRLRDQVQLGEQVRQANAYGDPGPTGTTVQPVPSGKDQLLLERAAMLASDWFDALARSRHLPDLTPGVQFSKPGGPLAPPEPPSSLADMDEPVALMVDTLIRAGQVERAWEVMRIADHSGAHFTPRAAEALLQGYTKLALDGAPVALDIWQRLADRNVRPTSGLVRTVVAALTWAVRSRTGPQNDALYARYRRGQLDGTLGGDAALFRPPTLAHVETANALEAEFRGAGPLTDLQSVMYIVRGYQQVGQPDRAVARLRAALKHTEVFTSGTNIVILLNLAGELGDAEAARTVVAGAERHDIPLEYPALLPLLHAAVSAQQDDLLDVATTALMPVIERGPAHPHESRRFARVITELITAHAHRGRTENVRHLLKALQHVPTVRTLTPREHTHVVKACGAARLPIEAWRFLQLLTLQHITVTSATWGAFLNLCIRNAYFTPINLVAKIIDRSAQYNIHNVGLPVYADLARAYAITGETHQVKAITERILNLAGLNDRVLTPTSYVWNSLLTALTRADLLPEVWYVYERSRTPLGDTARPVRGDSVTLSIMLNFCASHGRTDAVERLLADFRASGGGQLGVIQYLDLVALYARADQPELTLAYVTELCASSVGLAHGPFEPLALMRLAVAFASIGHFDWAEALFDHLRGRPHPALANLPFDRAMLPAAPAPPDAYAYNAILRACIQADELDRFEAHLAEFRASDIAWTAAHHLTVLIYHLARADRVAALAQFDLMQSRKLYLDDAMLLPFLEHYARLARTPPADSPPSVAEADTVVSSAPAASGLVAEALDVLELAVTHHVPVSVKLLHAYHPLCRGPADVVKLLETLVRLHESRAEGVPLFSVVRFLQDVTGTVLPVEPVTEVRTAAREYLKEHWPKAFALWQETPAPTMV